MTYDEVWKQLVQKRPALADPDAKVEFSSKLLRRLLDQVYAQGEQEGRKLAKATNSLNDIFGGL